ncbi:MAG: transketolase [Anaerolineales bacterium]
MISASANGRRPKSARVPENWELVVQSAADNIRLRVFGHIMKNRGGYLSQACSSAEMLAALYLKIMHLGESTAPKIPQPFAGVPGPDNPHFFNGGEYNGPQAPEYDRFIFSPAHYALVLYATLIEVGRMDAQGLEMFNKDGTTIEMIGAEHSPGVETTTGSLAQAISQAGGIALARKLKGEPGRVVVMMSDGEFQEGQTWEAIQAAKFHGLDNLIVYVDVNGQQCDGVVEDVMTIEPLAERIEVFGGRAVAVDGHDIPALVHAADVPHDGRPTIVLGYTDPTRGVPLLNDRRPFLHTVRFGSEAEYQQYQEAYQAMLRQNSVRNYHMEQVKRHLEEYHQIVNGGTH